MITTVRLRFGVLLSGVICFAACSQRKAAPTTAPLLLRTATPAVSTATAPPSPSPASLAAPASVPTAAPEAAPVPASIFRRVAGPLDYHFEVPFRWREGELPPNATPGSITVELVGVGYAASASVFVVSVPASSTALRFANDLAALDVRNDRTEVILEPARAVSVAGATSAAQLVVAKRDQGDSLHRVYYKPAMRGGTIFSFTLDVVASYYEDHQEDIQHVLDSFALTP